MKVLYLSPLYDVDSFSGVAIKNKMTTEWLRQHHTVDIVFFLGQSQTMNQFSGNKHPVLDFHVWKKTKYLIPEIVCSWFNMVPFNVMRFFSKQMKLAVNKLLSENNYDVIHVDHLWMYQYIPKEWNKPIIYEEHNIDSVYYNRYFQVVKNPIMKFIFQCESKRLYLYEKKVISRSNVILSISHADKLCLVQRGAKKKYTYVYPPSITTTRSDFKLSLPEGKPNILFLGGMGWPPNKHGFWWFYHMVWPLVLKFFPAAQWIIVGELNGINKYAVDNSNVHMFGFQEQLSPFFDWADIFISPIFFGSGIKIKMLYALKQGIPIIGSKISYEGIRLPQKDIIIADTPQNFLSAINDIMRRPSMYRKQALKLKKNIGVHYNRQRSSDALRLAYKFIK